MIRLATNALVSTVVMAELPIDFSCNGHSVQFLHNSTACFFDWTALVDNQIIGCVSDGAMYAQYSLWLVGSVCLTVSSMVVSFN